MKLIVRSRVCFLVALIGFSAGLASFSDGREKRPANTTVYSMVDPDYKRERLSDGSWKPETYVVGEGSLIDRSGSDASLSEMTFAEICELLAEAFRREQYVPAPVVEEAQLLIVISWGKTMPHDNGIGSLTLQGMSESMDAVGQMRRMVESTFEGGPARELTAGERADMESLEGDLSTLFLMQKMADFARVRANEYNAELLGYASTLTESHTSIPFGPQRDAYDTLLGEIETPRYFVILQVYDFQKLIRDKERRLLWTTRFSIRAKGRRFNEELASMASAASALFGRESGRLSRFRQPGHIEFGDPEVVGLEKGEPEGE